MSYSTSNTTAVTDLNGLFKDQFHSDVENLIPDHVVLQKDNFISWVPSDKMNGELYSIPTLLRSNQGVSYLGESGAAAALVNAKPGLMKEAQVKGSEIVVRGQLSYKALSQAASAGARAFKKSSAWLVEDLAQVAHTRIEIAALYGQTGLGTVSSVTDQATVSGQTVVDVVITAATFAPGMWVLLEGATIDAFTSTTKNNSNGVLTVQSVTTSTRTIRFIHQAGSGNGASEVAASDVLFFESSNAGSGSYNEICGLYAQLTATSGTLFNIDRSAYALMQGNSYDAAGALTKAKVIDAAMRAVDKGAMKDLVCMVGTASWASLHAEQMALQMFDQSYSEATSKSGSKEILYTAVNGQIKVVCHPFVRNGHAFIFAPEDILWVGSCKPTFEIPGMGEQFFRLLDSYSAVELQNYSDLAIYAIKPCQTVVITGIA